MVQYRITGMSCAACSARVEKAVSVLPGVSACSVNLLTNSMGVEGTASPEQIIAAVKKAGYGAALKEAAEKTPENPFADGETPRLKKRMFQSLLFLAVLMYLSMGHTMWHFPLPRFLAENPVAIGLLQLLLSVAVMIINRDFFIHGFQSLRRGSPTMDTLVALGASASFLWSVAVLFLMTDVSRQGDHGRAMALMHEFYFEAAAMILTLITLGKMLEARSKGKTTDALKGLMKLAPQTAVILREGKEVTLPADQVKEGDLFVVRPGERIPADGVVIEGNGAVDESALTGESVPCDKAPGDSVSAATINQMGFLTCRASRVGQDTALSRIIRMVSDASATKAPIAKAADKVSAVFVPAVMVISVITFAVWLLWGQPFSYALARSISVLVISCPCALGLATPVAIMVGSGVGARHGMLFKTAQALEETGKIRIAALDKTGTITKGVPQVTEILPAGNFSEEQLIKTALSLEQKSEHPLAGAICRYAEEKNITGEAVKDFTVLPGNGLSAMAGNSQLTGGSLSYVEAQVSLPPDCKEKAAFLSTQGKTPLLFTRDGVFAGIIAVADTVKEDSPQAIQSLKKMGIRVVMLTGDNPATAQTIGKQAGVDEVIAGVLPDGKEKVIRELKEQGKVVMVGDGINDAPALTAADIGIAIGTGTDIAIDAADVILMRSTLSDLPAALRLSRATLRNIYENLFWAFIYNIIGIPLAAGVFTGLGLTLNPMFSSAAMSLSSFCVVTNALRLNFFNPHTPRSHRRKKNRAGATPNSSGSTPNSSSSAPELTKTLHIQGMMCQHCENRVQKALSALPQVESVAVSHETGVAEIRLKQPVSDSLLKQTVEAQGYPVTSIEP